MASRYVAIIGPGDTEDARLTDAAHQCGRLLAEHGIIVVTGGLGGVMAAACEGATSAGGLSIGLQPSAERHPGYDSPTAVIPTGLGQARNALVVNAADCVLAIGSNWGTLSEVALAARAGKPVVWLDGWHIADVKGAAQSAIEHVADADQAIVRVLDLLR